MQESQKCVYDFPMRIRVYETDETKLFFQQKVVDGNLVNIPREIKQLVQEWRRGRILHNPQTAVNRDWLDNHYRPSLFDEVM